MTEAATITEADFIAPLVLLRFIAAQEGVTLSELEEQQICRDVTGAITSVLYDAVRDCAHAG